MRASLLGNEYLVFGKCMLARIFRDCSGKFEDIQRKSETEDILNIGVTESNSGSSDAEG